MNYMINLIVNLISMPYVTIYAFVCTSIFCLIFQIVCLRKQRTKKHFLKVYLFLLYLMSVYYVTGTGSIWDMMRPGFMIRPETISLNPFENTIDMLDVLNVMMMMPLGFLLPWIWPAFRNIWKTTLAGMIFSFFIEISQLLNLRATTTEDLITNTLGTFLGYLIFKIIYKIFKSKKTCQNDGKFMKEEAVIYLIGSFLGIFLLYNPLALINFMWKI